ncbi:hypothetical protein ACJX0J_024282, partial [Zea mays]
MFISGRPNKVAPENKSNRLEAPPNISKVSFTSLSLRILFYYLKLICVDVIEATHHMIKCAIMSTR